MKTQLEDWVDLSNIVETIRMSRGITQKKALELYFEKVTIYELKYEMRFNLLKRP